MNASQLKIALGATMLSAAVGAAEPKQTTATPVARGQQILRAGSQPSVAAPAEHFTGHVRIDPAWPTNDDINVSGGFVTFEPGARSDWHTHTRGQVLVVVSGVGLTQEWGKPVQEIRPGDVVWCAPGVKHWHGAAPTAAMTHLAITGTVNGKYGDWLEKVSNEQYSAK